MTASNMTVEDRLAEKLKSAEFAAWFGEDDLRELVAKAIKTAFFTERAIPDPNRGYGTVKIPALIEHLALEHVKETMNKLVQQALADEFAKDPAMLERAVAKAIGDGLETLVLNAIGKSLSSALFQSEANAVNRITEALRNGNLVR